MCSDANRAFGLLTEGEKDALRGLGQAGTASYAACGDGFGSRKRRRPRALAGQVGKVARRQSVSAGAVGGVGRGHDDLAVQIADLGKHPRANSGHREGIPSDVTTQEHFESWQWLELTARLFA